MSEIYTKFEAKGEFILVHVMPAGSNVSAGGLHLPEAQQYTKAIVMSIGSDVTINIDQGESILFIRPEFELPFQMSGKRIFVVHQRNVCAKVE